MTSVTNNTCGIDPLEYTFRPPFKPKSIYALPLYPPARCTGATYYATRPPFYSSASALSVVSDNRADTYCRQYNCGPFNTGIVYNTPSLYQDEYARAI